MQLDIETVINTPELLDTYVYVCALVQTNYSKPLVKIEPMKCIVVSKETYYNNADKIENVKHDNVLLRVNTRLKAQPVSWNKVISSARNHSISHLKVFDNMAECVSCYQNL